MFREGLVTEELYLTHWRRRYRDRVTITLDPDPAGPLQLVERAVEAKAREDLAEKRGRGRAHDQIWCVFDRDEHPTFAEAITLAASKGINVAVSNPCIELWFVLHFEDQTAYIERDHAQTRAGDLLGCRKRLTNAALEMLHNRYEDAAERARSLDAKHEGDGSPQGANPSSSVHRLLDAIRDA